MTNNKYRVRVRCKAFGWKGQARNTVLGQEKSAVVKGHLRSNGNVREGGSAATEAIRRSLLQQCQPSYHITVRDTTPDYENNGGAHARCNRQQASTPLGLGPSQIESKTTSGSTYSSPLPLPPPPFSLNGFPISVAAEIFGSFAASNETVAIADTQISKKKATITCEYQITHRTN